MAATAQPVPAALRGTSRVFVVPPCQLNPADLRRLFTVLSDKAVEAAAREVAPFVQQPNQTPAQFEEFKTSVKTGMQLVVRLFTRSGAWVVGSTVDSLSDEKIPDGLTRIEFDSAFVFRSRFNQIPNNAFNLVLDLNRPRVLDMSPEPIQNGSVANVSGMDSTWVNSICDELATFFHERIARRGWLHFPQSYSFALFFFGFPLSFYAVYHLDRVIRRHSTFPEALSVAIYVYVVLMALFVFRIVFNYARWVFPKVEVDAPRQHVAVKHRISIIGLGGMILAAVVAAILKLFGIG